MEADTSSPSAETPPVATPISGVASGAMPPVQFGRIQLDIGNSVLPAAKLNPTPSSKDGLSEEAELQIRSLGCDLIQIAGKLLKLPQVSRFLSYWSTRSQGAFLRWPWQLAACSSSASTTPSPW